MASILFRGGVVHSPADPFAQAILIEDGVVAWLGADDSAGGFASRADEVVDLDGLLVTPAFVDARVDLLALGAHRAGLDSPRGGLDHDTHRALTDEALQHAASRGIVALHEMGADATSRADLADLIDRTAAPQSMLPHVSGYWSQIRGAQEEARDLREAIPGLVGVNWDFGVDGRTRGPEPTVERIAAHVLSAAHAGLPSAFQVGGELAMRVMIDGLRRAAAASGENAIRMGGHRIGCAGPIDSTAISALVQLGVRLDLQPNADGEFEAPLADLAAAGVPFGFGSGSSASALDPWSNVQAALLLDNEEQRVSARAAFRAHTRGGWRLAGLDHTGAGELRVGAPAHLAFWESEQLAVQGPERMFSAWSTDARAGTPLLPDLSPDSAAPRCVRTMRDGVVIFDSLA